jgi:hypothetical protein
MPTPQAHTGEGFGYALAAGNFNPTSDLPRAYDDLAVGVPGDNAGRSGAVNIFHGTESVFAMPGTAWYQGKGGAESGSIGDVREEDDGFGKALASNDFDGNGAADLAIGVPGEDVGSQKNAGAVNVVSSSGTGLDPGVGPSQFWTENSRGVTGSSEAGDIFGASVGSSDFNNDGRDDLTIGSPLENLGSLTDAGALTVIPGSTTGPRASGGTLWHEDITGIQGAAESFDNFGATTA